MLRFAVVLVLVAAVASAAGYVWFSRTILAELPSDLTRYRDWVPLTNVRVLDADGEPVDRFYVERREWVPLDELPDHVWQSFVAAEDRRFFRHRGVDGFGIARALATNAISGETRSGASTLTQQLVKNLLVGSERSYERKMKEAVLAYRLERDVGKQRILELYVNYIALGSGNYGVEAAAQDYFGVSARELTVGQATLLAGLVPAPSRYSPRLRPETARQRRRIVLGRMVKAGYLSDEDAELAAEEPFAIVPRESAGSPVNAAYLTEVRREIRRLFGDEAPFQAGITVTTALRPAIQQVAVDAVRAATDAHLVRQGPRGVRGTASTPPPAADTPCFLARATASGRQIQVATTGGTWVLDDPDTPVQTEEGPVPLRRTLVPGALLRVCPGAEGHANLEKAPWSQAAAIVVEIATGEVVAVAGGRDVALEGFVRATQARRQPGSSFKPYVYAAALETQPLTQLSVMADTPITLGDWSPRNYGGGYAGSMTLRSALARSINTIAVRLAVQSGVTRVTRLATALGVRTPLREDPTVALGSSEVTPLDQAMAYTGLLRGGVPTEPVWLTEVHTVEGEEVFTPGQTLAVGDVAVPLPGGPGKRVLRPSTAYQVVDMLREVVRAGTARRAFDPERDRGGKTGTTNDFVDAWFVGFTAKHVIAVWVGTDGVSSLGPSETGGRAALPAWIQIAEALDEAPGDRVEPPPEVALVPHEGITVALPWAAVR